MKFSNIFLLAGLSLVVSAALANETYSGESLGHLEGSDPQHDVPDIEVYVGGSFGQLEYSDRYFDEFSPNFLFGTLGLKFNEYFSIEFKLGRAVGDNSIREEDVPSNPVISRIEITDFKAVYIKGGIPVNKTLSPYIAVGSSKFTVKESDFTSSFELESFTSSNSSASYGIGVDFNFDGFSLNVDFSDYKDSTTRIISGFSVGISKSFQ